VAEEVEALEAEPPANLLDLLTEPLDPPEIRVLRLVRVVGAELVVVVELDALLRQEVLEALEVLVRAAGPPWRVRSLIFPDPTFLVQTRYLPSTGINRIPPVLTSNPGRTGAGAPRAAPLARRAATAAAPARKRPRRSIGPVKCALPESPELDRRLSEASSVSPSWTSSRKFACLPSPSTETERV
jgi:hypothetical protein